MNQKCARTSENKRGPRCEQDIPGAVLSYFGLCVL